MLDFILIQSLKIFKSLTIENKQTHCEMLYTSKARFRKSVGGVWYCLSQLLCNVFSALSSVERREGAVLALTLSD